MENIRKIEAHPFEPFLPEKARIIMLGTFPPKPERWSMPFYYPNKINDMWRIMGLLFYADASHFWDDVNKSFRLSEIKRFLSSHNIALWDTAMKVCRLKDNASDKFLDILQPINLATLFEARPTIEGVVTAGEKATSVIAEMAGVDVPKIGEMVDCSVAGHKFRLCRMPSSSRAYPLPLALKAEAYGKMLAAFGYQLHNNG